MDLGNLQVILNTRMTIAQEKTCDEFVASLKPLAAISDIRTFVLELKEKDLYNFIVSAFTNVDGSPLHINGIEWAPIKDVIACVKAYLDERDDYSDCQDMITDIKGKLA